MATLELISLDCSAHFEIGNRQSDSDHTCNVFREIGESGEKFAGDWEHLVRVIVRGRTGEPTTSTNDKHQFRTPCTVQ